VAILDLADRRLRYLAGEWRDHNVAGWLGSDALLVRGPGAPITFTRVALADGAASPWRVLPVSTVGFMAVDTALVRANGSRYAYSYGQELSQLYLMTA
jgi:hypothetical protein